MTDKTFTNTKSSQDFLDTLTPTISYGISNITTIIISNWENLTTLQKTSVITTLAANGFLAID